MDPPGTKPLEITECPAPSGYHLPMAPQLKEPTSHHYAGALPALSFQNLVHAVLTDMLALVQVPGCLGDYKEPFLANGFQNITVLLWDGCGVNVSYSK